MDTKLQTRKETATKRDATPSCNSLHQHLVKDWGMINEESDCRMRKASSTLAEILAEKRSVLSFTRHNTASKHCYRLTARVPQLMNSVVIVQGVDMYTEWSWYIYGEKPGGHVATQEKRHWHSLRTQWFWTTFIILTKFLLLSSPQH